MALYKDFPESPFSTLDPAIRWFPADEALRAISCTPGRRKLAVKVVDIFGNDTMTIVEVRI